MVRDNGITDKRLGMYASFSPAIVHWDIIKRKEDATKPAAWSLPAALLFVDIAGFTALCTQLDVSVLQAHINNYFSALINAIYDCSGDVLKFAGDAIVCGWFVRDAADVSFAARTACECALKLVELCGSRSLAGGISEQLTVHVGLGVGMAHLFRVGSEERQELLVYGEAMQQAFAAEHEAAASEVVCSREAWALVTDVCDGDPRGHIGQAVLRRMTTLPAVEQLKHTLLASGLLRLQRSRLLHTQIKHASSHRYHLERMLRSFAHQDLCQEIDACIDPQELVIAEQRTVAVAFCKVVGLTSALETAAAGLDAVQRCMLTALEVITASGGLLRQFIVDDKGVVLMWTFGLHGSSASALGSRGLHSCVEMSKALETQQLQTYIGLTSGMVYCGLVGGPYRAEYNVLGPSVILAARLMGVCAGKGIKLLCDAAIHERVLTEQSPQSPGSLGVRSPAVRANMAKVLFTFSKLDPLVLKGYDEAVPAFAPHMEAKPVSFKDNSPHTKDVQQVPAQGDVFAEDEGRGGGKPAAQWSVRISARGKSRSTVHGTPV